MPHYEDGTEARLKDMVVGKTYNLNGRVIVGTVLEIIPGSDSCNLRVAFAEVSTRPDATVEGGGIVYSPGDSRLARSIIKAGYDYGETKAFRLVARS